MKVPDFNAESSLYRTKVSYHTAGDLVRSVAGMVRPALGSSCRQLCQGDPDCMRCCMCVRRGGDPSQCCF